MEILHFLNGQPPIRYEALMQMPAEGYVWIDLARSEAPGWEQHARRLLNIEVDLQHLQDALNPTHPTSFDGTEHYDLLVFEGLGPNAEPLPLDTRVSCLFLFERLLVSIHADDGLSYPMAKKRLCSGRLKPPNSVTGLAHLVLDVQVDRFLNIREALDQQLGSLQDELLDGGSNLSDWRKLLTGRLEALSEAQLEALDAWRRSTRFDWNTSEEVRVRDLVEHVTRVRHHASALERDLEAAVQLHFAITSQRTNEVMKLLAVMSVIFMPLTLMTGIWGMNFEDMPELHWRYGYPLALALIATVGSTTLLWFRRRKFF